MSDNKVIISVSEEELIVSLYHDYLIRHGMSSKLFSYDEMKMSVKAFSDYILEYLKDLYHLEDKEETDA